MSWPQLTERRKGNAAYQRRDFAEALGHYDRARAVVDFVKGISAADQVRAREPKLVCSLSLMHARLSA